MRNKTEDGFAAADGEKVRTAPIKSDSDEMLLYRGANGEALSLATTAKEMLLNSIIPYRKRALRAERRLEKARTEMVEKLNRVKELEKLDFEESYGKPNNYGGLKGFVISPVNISSIDVIHDNDAALIWFGDRRIAPRLRDWLEDHRDVLPKDAKNIKPGRKPVNVDAKCVKLANGMMVGKGDVIWISVMDKRRSVQMKVTGFGRWPDGEYNVRGMVPRRDGVSRTLSGGPSDTLSVVHERRVIG